MTGTCHCWPSHINPLESRVKLALVQAGVEVVVGVGVMVTVHEQVFAAETRVTKVVGSEVAVEVVRVGLDAERGKVRVVLPEMARTLEDETVLTDMVGTVTPAGVEVRDVRVDAAADAVVDAVVAAVEAVVVAAAVVVVLAKGGDKVLVVAAAVAPLTVRPSAAAMAKRGAVLMVAAVTTQSPFVVRVTGFVKFSRVRQPRLPVSNDAE